MNPYISRTISRDRRSSGYIDIVAPNKEAAIKFMKGKGVFMETLDPARRINGRLVWGTYGFYKKKPELGANNPLERMIADDKWYKVKK